MGPLSRRCSLAFRAIFDRSHSPAKLKVTCRVAKVMNDEIERAICINGRHNRGAGFAADLEKYLEASLAGWRVVRFGPNDELASDHTARLPDKGIDAVVHLTALAGVRPSMDRPFVYLSTNVRAG